MNKLHIKFGENKMLMLFFYTEKTILKEHNEIDLEKVNSTITATLSSRQSNDM